MISLHKNGKGKINFVMHNCLYQVSSINELNQTRIDNVISRNMFVDVSLDKYQRESQCKISEVKGGIDIACIVSIELDADEMRQEVMDILKHNRPFCYDCGGSQMISIADKAYEMHSENDTLFYLHHCDRHVDMQIGRESGNLLISYTAKRKLPLTHGPMRIRLGEVQDAVHVDDVGITPLQSDMIYDVMAQTMHN